MKLVLIRHADAGDADAIRYPDDRTRPLTTAGEREHAAVAGALALLDLHVTDVLSSPLARARQTATITARALDVAEVRVVDALGDRFRMDDLLAELSALPPDATVACVGHEPHMSRLAARLLHADGNIRVAFAKSAVMVLDFQGHPGRGTARLVFFMSPRETLRLIE
ncbi:MAG: histidine phosphatase family protein [Candidatus Rokubacteria bacterium]|nr:histidine phosphatase family protein [Candidatus Rokubacteria bacterium]